MYSAKKIAKGNGYQQESEVFNGAAAIRQIDISETKNFNLDLEINAGTFQVVLIVYEGRTIKTDF